MSRELFPKQIADQLKASGRNVHKIHHEVYPPWGQYDSIDHDEDEDDTVRFEDRYGRA